MVRDTRYFEDIRIDDERRMGSFSFTESEIIEFAERFDPLPFHTDRDAADRSIFGGLIASGYHTTAKSNRLLVENYFSDTAMRGALGIDDLRWEAPVRPGDELTVRGRITEKHDFNDQLGLGHGDVTVTDQAGEVVLTMTGKLLFDTRAD